ncbi:MAG: hypothetical protein AABX33_05665 [Nanoarchaeota archaeon]
MRKKIFVFPVLLLAFGALLSGFTYAFDISIDRVTINGNVVSESGTNLIDDANFFSVAVEYTALRALNNAHVEAVLRGQRSGNTISDSTSTFSLAVNQKSVNVLRLALIDGLKRENEYDLTINILDGRGTLEQRTYAIRTRQTISAGLDVSIDRVRLNGQIVAPSRTNFINKSNFFDVLVDFTALENLENARIEAILRDTASGTSVADATANFNLESDSSSSKLLRLTLLDRLKDSSSFELTIKVIDTERNLAEQTYGIRTKNGISAFGARGVFDVSIDRVQVNGKAVAQSRTNFIEESNDFDVLVDFTALADLEDAHVEVILRDFRSGTVVADSTPIFDLQSDSSSSRLLKLELLDKLKDSNSFELTVKIVDAEGNSFQKVYGLAMEDNGKEGIARGLDISIDSVELESQALAENENNFVVIGNNQKELDLSVKLTSLDNVNDAHIDAVLAFENGDVVADATATFDVNKNQNAVRKLELPLIGSFGQNSFKLKVRIIDAEGDSEEKLYGLKISQKKFPFIMSSISLSPEDNIEAGKNLIVKLRFKNLGVVPLDGINAKVSIPELGTSSTKFVDNMKNSGKFSDVSEDFIIKILDNAETGTYTLKSEISSQFGPESEEKEMPIFVLGKEEQKKEVVNEKLVINVPIVKQDIKNDGSEVIYPLALTNQGRDTNAYTILLDGANWAGLRLAESNMVVLKPKDSKTINVYASSKGNTIGEQIFLVTIKSNGEVLKDISLKGNVIEVRGLLAANLKHMLELALIGFAVLLAAIGIFIGIKNYIQGNSRVSEEIPDQEQGEAYY